ncbi:MAG: anaerobic nitric oxide reductase flavorubredoxin [Tepidanaerobacteraceae bacterium]|jgi:anaerobic nitric oxide reductase flavorubredoxin
MSFKINESVTWVGKIDWELQTFHGMEYTTHRGTAYNSYLVKDEKVALIDTVWEPFAEEFVENLEKEISLDKIDYIIANHGEIDHSGALPALMRKTPNTPIYCTQNGIKSLKGQYHQDWNFVPVKTGDKLSLGKKDLIFVEAPMLHWPDSMFAYLTGDNILFSNDAFGQHYATENMYNDLVDQAELYQEAIKYYANILTPFSKLVDKKIDEVLSLNLPVDMICPSHGVIWRDNPLQIVKKYQEWARDYQENQVAIVYDTMWNGTRRMAESIAQGIKEVNEEITVKLYNCARSDNNDIVTEVFKSKGIVVGSPTINRTILHAVAGFLGLIKGLGFKNKKAAAFGAYGWSGESVKVITEELKESGFEVVDEGLKLLWYPDDEGQKLCKDFGRKLGEELKN